MNRVGELWHDGALREANFVGGQTYDEAKALAATPASTARRPKNLQDQAHALKMKLIPA